MQYPVFEQLQKGSIFQYTPRVTSNQRMSDTRNSCSCRRYLNIASVHRLRWIIEETHRYPSCGINLSQNSSTSTHQNRNTALEVGSLCWWHRYRCPHLATKEVRMVFLKVLKLCRQQRMFLQAYSEAFRSIACLSLNVNLRVLKWLALIGFFPPCLNISYNTSKTNPKHATWQTNNRGDGIRIYAYGWKPLWHVYKQKPELASYLYIYLMERDRICRLFMLILRGPYYFLIILPSKV